MNKPNNVEPKYKKTCLNRNCPERTGGECTAGVHSIEEVGIIARISDEVFGSRFVDENNDQFNEFENRVEQVLNVQYTKGYNKALENREKVCLKDLT